MKDEYTVVFKEGTTREQVDAINAEIGATIVIAPMFHTAYRIRVPPGLTYQAVSDFYHSKPQVQSVIPAVNYCQELG